MRKGQNPAKFVKDVAHPERITALNRGNYLTFKAIRDAEVPVVVAVHKFVIGGGIGICGASDTIIAADDAYFSLPEVDRGAMGGASHLSRMLPLHKVVIKRCTASLPLPSMPSTAKITQVLPTLGSRPHAVACFGDATTCSLWTSPL